MWMLSRSTQYKNGQWSIQNIKSYQPWLFWKIISKEPQIRTIYLIITVQPMKPSTPHGIKSLQYHGAHLWNSLPADIKSAVSISQFKGKSFYNHQRLWCVLGYFSEAADSATLCNSTVQPHVGTLYHKQGFSEARKGNSWAKMRKWGEEKLQYLSEPSMKPVGKKQDILLGCHGTRSSQWW